MPSLQYCLAWWTHSSLPEFGTLFIGREKEISDLTTWLDLHNDEVRVVSIVGPPGIGKSSLALQVGNQMRDRGAVVSYVDGSLVFLDGLPNQILRNAGISKGGNSSQRLLQWIGSEMNQPLVIIIDNCDAILTTDGARFYYFLDVIFASAATVVKVIITSRKTVKPMHHSEHFIDYPLREFNPDASCQLLHTVSKREISTATCESIIKLTGNIPLTLELVGTTLESKTTDISKVIASLEKEMSSLSFEKRVDASIRVSLKYLKYKLINLGRYLSLFPGSFSMTSACSVLSAFLNEDCAWVDTLRQRALLRYCGDNRYKFRDIVQEHFVKIKDRIQVNENKFWSEFLKHFLALLRELSLEFQDSPKTALELLEVEKQDLRYFLRNAPDCCEELPNIYLELLQSLKISIDTGFLMSFYAEGDLVDLLRNSLTCLELVVKNSELNSNPEIKTDVVHQHVYFTMLIIDLRSMEAGAVFEKAQVWLDQYIDSANSSVVETFYLKLSTHYSSLGKLQKELHCHVKILKKLSVLSNCDLSTCI